MEVSWTNRAKLGLARKFGMIESETIDCDMHGAQSKTFVCQHIAAGLVSRGRVGFFWTTCTPDNPRPDAWCAECAQRVSVTNGEWIGEAERHLKAKILCGACYDVAKTFHMGGDPWS